MTRSADTDRICSECWDRATYAYGTGTIFLRRSRRYRNKLRLLSFVGIVVPLIVGGLVMSFGTTASHLPYVLLAAGAMGVLQLVLSAWSIVYSWADALEYALTSTSTNFELAEGFKELGRSAPDPPTDLGARFAVLRARDEDRRSLDTGKSVSQKELRYGHRAGLRRYGRQCEGCKKIPLSMDSTKCDVCGRF